MTLEEYQDVKGEWRWRIEAGNEKIIADSGEGYKNRDDMRHAIDLIGDALDSYFKAQGEVVGNADPREGEPAGGKGDDNTDP